LIEVAAELQKKDSHLFFFFLGRLFLRKFLRDTKNFFDDSETETLELNIVLLIFIY